MKFKNINENSQLNEKKLSPNDKVKNAYVSEYPDDELGADINAKVTFEQCFMGMRKGKDIYDLIDVEDSVVRERVFKFMSQVYNVDYDIIYNLWMGDCLMC